VTIWRTCIAYRIPKSTNTHSEYIYSTVTLVAQTLLNVTCTYITCVVRSAYRVHLFILFYLFIYLFFGGSQNK
jgi:hypothetical protein